MLKNAKDSQVEQHLWFGNIPSIFSAQGELCVNVCVNVCVCDVRERERKKRDRGRTWWSVWLIVEIEEAYVTHWHWADCILVSTGLYGLVLVAYRNPSGQRLTYQRWPTGFKRHLLQLQQVTNSSPFFKLGCSSSANSKHIVRKNREMKAYKKGNRKRNVTLYPSKAGSSYCASV